MERSASKTTVYRIPIRQIVANTNPRNPLGPELQKLGWTVFEPTQGLVPIAYPEKPSLWELGTSNHASWRAEFVRLFQAHDPEFVAWASTFITQGQLQPVEVRDNGKKGDNDNTYTLVFGCRRCLAILYNWALTGRPREPIVEARLGKGNNVSCLYRAVVENQRRQQSPVEDATSIRFALNQGVTEDEVCSQFGFSPDTLRRRLQLLELPVPVQKKVHAGELTATKALRDAEKLNGEPAASMAEDPDKPRTPRVRSRKAIEEVLAEYADGTAVGKVLRWVLGLREDF